MSVLILEDDRIKGRKIQQVFEEDALASSVVESASECLKFLRETHYDILVLDLLVPWDKSTLELPDNSYSKAILSEIAEGKCKAPKYVIGITQDLALWNSQQEYFNERGWILLHYEEGLDWRSLLKDRIKHARNVNQSGHTNDVDLAIITALHEEAVAVLELNDSLTRLEQSDSGLTYYRGSIGDCTVVLFVASEMGVAATASLASYIAERFRPKLLAMCGIAAGISDGLKLGDVVIAQKVWDYASGKIVEDESLAGKLSRFVWGRSRWSFKPTTNMAELDPRLSQWVASLKSSAGSNWWIPKGCDPFNMEMGPVACGPWVVGNRVVADWLLERERKLLALEMELYGLYLAPRVALERPFKILGIKGISDLADPRKNQNPTARSMAARNSVRVLQQLITLGLKRHI